MGNELSPFFLSFSFPSLSFTADPRGVSTLSVGKTSGGTDAIPHGLRPPRDAMLDWYRC